VVFSSICSIVSLHFIAAEVFACSTKPTSEKFNTHENARDGQSTLEHYEQADIEHKTKIQNTAENNDCMNTGIVHAKRKVSPRGTTDQIPKMEQLHQKTQYFEFWFYVQCLLVHNVLM
jgi:hypothetical protein